MPIAIDDPRLEFIPVNEAVEPRFSMTRNYRDHWWLTHPETGDLVIFHHHPFKMVNDKKYWRGQGSAQCNENKSITERVGRLYPWARLEFVPMAFLRLNVSEYCE